MYRLSGRYETRLNDIMEIYVSTMKIGNEEKIITGYGLLLKLRDTEDIKDSIKPLEKMA